MIPWTPFDEARRGNISQNTIACWACFVAPDRFEYLVGVWRKSALHNVVMQRSGSLTMLHDGSFYSAINPPVTTQRLDDAIPVTATDVNASTLSAQQPPAQLNP